MQVLNKEILVLLQSFLVKENVLFGYDVLACGLEEVTIVQERGLDDEENNLFNGTLSSY